MKKIIILTTILILFGASLTVFAQSRALSVEYKRNKDGSYDFYYKKNDPGSFTLTVKLSKLKNTQSSGYNGIVKGSYGKLFKLRPIHDKVPISFSYTSSYIRGAVNPKVDKDFVYIFPFGKGKTVDVDEHDNLGEKYFDKTAPKNWKSYAFKLPSSDTVYAARKGVVVDVINLYQPDTLNNYRYMRKRNRILIEHADGTFVSYSGFIKDKIFVRVGETVYPQTPLGTLDRYDARETYYLSFMVYFLTRENNRTASKREYLTPWFYTSEGKLQLASGEEYTVDFNNEILTQELTRREKKKRIKNKKSGKGK